MAGADVDAVGALRRSPSQRLAVDANDDGWSRIGPLEPLQRLVASRVPQPIDLVECADEALVALGDGGLEVQSQRPVLGRPRGVRSCTGTQPEDQPAAADLLHARCAERHDAGVAVGHVHHQRAQADACGRRRHRPEEREALDHRVAPEHVAGEVVEHPGGTEACVLGHEQAVPDGLPPLGGRIELDVDVHGRWGHGRWGHGRWGHGRWGTSGDRNSTATDRGATQTVTGEPVADTCDVSCEVASSRHHSPGSCTVNSSGSHHALAIT